VWKQDASTFEDAGTNYDLTMLTSWINLKNLAGFQRVRRWAVIGDVVDTATFKIEVWYDDDDSGAASQTDTVNVTASTVLSLRGRLDRQKCRSVRIKITATPYVVSNDSGRIKFNGLQLEVAGKGGLDRLQNSKTI
jgi:hypothetical protein